MLHSEDPINLSRVIQPAKKPLLRREMAEIMGGRIPVTQIKAKAPESLDETVIGEVTAIEIRWLDEG